uniref:hypothetical protein n=1 Tax=Scandinavium goeteborgense TaxID=1851514 RepID=UPI00135A39AF|nr:hypothetical protein [Scandinavium goeteborgense]
MNKSRRHFLAGGGALAIGSMLPGGVFPKNAFASQTESLRYASVTSVAEMDQIAPFVSMPNNGKVLLRQMTTDLLKNRIEKSVGPIIGKVMGKTVLGTIAPFLFILFDIIFPNNAPTWDDIKAEIDKQIKKALSEYEFIQIQKKFHALLDAYSLRMETVASNNSGIEDKSLWNLGTPGDWEALLNMCLEIKNYFYNNNEFDRHYEAFNLVRSFDVIYFIALSSRLQCFNPGDDIGSTVMLMNEFYEGQYSFLEKLANDAFYKVHHARHDVRTRGDMQSGSPWQVYNYYSSNDDLSGWYSRDDAAITEYMIGIRLRFYFLINTEIENFCESHTIAVESFNKLFDKKIPPASPMFKKFVQDNYVYYMYAPLADSSISDGGGWAGLTKPSHGSGYESYSISDGHVAVYDKNNKKIICPPGDYPNLLSPSNEEHIGIDVSTIVIPRGLRAILYSEANFGEYKDETSGEIHYKGDSYLKPLQNVIDFSDGDKLPKWPVKSMKVRIDPAQWFHELPGKTVGRVPLLEYKNVGFYTVGDIVLAPKF